ncbi:MAG: hypothetical protein FWD85_07405 [Microbacteriaceae bacterium]|nr:hypothetical protein [Microbacteriaceae bacterium]MCL2795118.1 hypothetical protein [Microbacteriaceae bacterium]
MSLGVGGAIRAILPQRATRLVHAPRAALAGTGREVPAVAVRAALGVLLVALAFLHLGDAWGWIALFAALGGVLSPWPALAWVAMASLALSELAEPARAAWHPYVLLAGIAVAQVLAARVAITPVRARVAVRVFARPLAVAAAITVPCEALLAVALWLRGTPHGTWLPAVALGVLALLALGGLLIYRLLQRG